MSILLKKNVLLKKTLFYNNKNSISLFSTFFTKSYSSDFDNKNNNIQLNKTFSTINKDSDSYYYYLNYKEFVDQPCLLKSFSTSCSSSSPSFFFSSSSSSSTFDSTLDKEANKAISFLHELENNVSPKENYSNFDSECDNYSDKIINKINDPEKTHASENIQTQKIEQHHENIYNHEKTIEPISSNYMTNLVCNELLEEEKNSLNTTSIHSESSPSTYFSFHLISEQEIEDILKNNNINDSYNAKVFLEEVLIRTKKQLIVNKEKINQIKNFILNEFNYILPTLIHNNEEKLNKLLSMYHFNYLQLKKINTEIRKLQSDYNKERNIVEENKKSEENNEDEKLDEENLFYHENSNNNSSLQNSSLNDENSFLKILAKNSKLEKKIEKEIEEIDELVNTIRSKNEENYKNNLYDEKSNELSKDIDMKITLKGLLIKKKNMISTIKELNIIKKNEENLLNDSLELTKRREVYESQLLELEKNRDYLEYYYSKLNDKFKQFSK